MIDLMVTVITALVVGVVTLWSFSPALRRSFEAPKHAALARSKAYLASEPVRPEGGHGASAKDAQTASLEETSQ